MSKLNIVVIGWRRKNTVVQQRRPDQEGAGRWEFPGGKVEPGETPDHAMVREFNEEVGIPVRVVSLIDWRVQTFKQGPTLLLAYEVDSPPGLEPISMEGQVVDTCEQPFTWAGIAHD